MRLRDDVRSDNMNDDVNDVRHAIADQVSSNMSWWFLNMIEVKGRKKNYKVESLMINHVCSRPRWESNTYTFFVGDSSKASRHPH